MLRPSFLRGCQLASTTSRIASRTITGLSYTQLVKLRCLVQQEQTVSPFLAHARLCSTSAAEAPPKEIKKKTDVSYEELLVSLDSGNIQLFDVREPKEFEDGAIPTAVNLPLKTVKPAFQKSPEEFYTTYGVSKPKTTDTNLVFYGLCSIKSISAVEICHKNGYKKAKHFPGGWEEWIARQSEK